MEVSSYLKLTDGQRSKRRQQWKERQKKKEQGRDPEREIAQDRALKALFLVKQHLSNEITLSDIEINTYCALIIDRSKKSIFFLAKYVLEFDLFTEKTHKRWSDDLMAAIRKDIRRVMRLKPRKTFKTSLYGISFILWLWGCISPGIRIFYTSSSGLLIEEVADALDTYVGTEKNETLYSFIFGITRQIDKKNTSNVFNIHGRQGKGFSLILRTSGGSTTGVHPNVIIVDDAVGEKDRDFEVERRSKERWFDTLQPLLVPFDDPSTGLHFESIYYIGTRWHMHDLVYYIENELIKKKGQEWDIESESIVDDRGDPSYPEFYPKEKIEADRKSMSDVFFACNPAGAPILMSDFTTKDIKDIKVGDKVVGFTLARGMKNKSKLIETEVLATGSRIADVVKITLESGRVIRCTPDHKWYVGRSDNGRLKGMNKRNSYLPAKIGRNLLRVVDCHYEPTYEELLDWRYLGGMIDGEGACKYGNLMLYQSSEKNPEVFKKICEILEKLNISYSTFGRKNRTDLQMFHLRGGRDLRAKIIRFSDCAKKFQILDGLWKSNRTVTNDRSHIWKDFPKLKGNQGRDKVVKIEPDGMEIVYSFQTTTGNYVVWGYASKNCQMMNSPLPEGLQTFDLKRLTFIRPSQFKEIFRYGQLICGFDPSLGKKHSDYPAVWWAHYYNDTITFFDAIDEKIELSLLVHHIAARNQLYRCRKMVYEDNGVTLVRKAIDEAHNRINWKIDVEPVHHGPDSNKHERIVSTQPDMYSGYVQFLSDYERRYPEGMNQIVFYGAYTNDDFPDCAEMIISYFRQPHFNFQRYDGIL